MHINEIAEVVAGYAFRGAITSDVAGNALVFQAKDLVQGDPFNDVSTLAKIFHDTPGHAGYLKRNDILLVARGMKSGSFRSTVFASDVPNVIASSSVHVIRIISTDVLPEYVSHYLNSKEGQDALSQIVSGSYVGALPRKELEQIDVPIPTLRKQEAIVSLYNNMRAQQQILDRKSEIKQNIINEAFRNLTP